MRCPAAKPPVREADQWRGPGGTGRFPQLEPTQLALLVILLGFLWMLWDPRKQTWHDKAARSLPVKL